MAAYAACKRAGLLRANQAINLAALRGLSPAAANSPSPSSSFSSAWSSSRIDCRQISQLVQSNGKRLFLVDTLALVRRLEAQGVPSKQAEAITSAITEVLNDSLENVAQSFVSRGEMQRIEMTQEANLSKFKSQVQSSQNGSFITRATRGLKAREGLNSLRAFSHCVVSNFNISRTFSKTIVASYERMELAIWPFEEPLRICL